MLGEALSVSKSMFRFKVALIERHAGLLALLAIELVLIVVYGPTLLEHARLAAGLAPSTSRFSYAATHSQVAPSVNILAP